LRRFGTPEDVADSVLLVASDKASYITGTFIEVAGGKFCVQDPMTAWNIA
jgi:3-oxoacyl-[acyl-carrier protein] reductase